MSKVYEVSMGDIIIEVWFETACKLWAGCLIERATGFTIGNAWYAVSRDESFAQGGVYWYAHNQAEKLCQAETV